MRKFLRAHTNTILVSITTVFLALIIGYFAWGIGYIVTEVNSANTGTASTTQVSNFDLKDAASLDYKGATVTPTPAAVTSSATSS